MAQMLTRGARLGRQSARLCLRSFSALPRVYTREEVSKFEDVTFSMPAPAVAKLTLNNPKARNALSTHMMRVLQTRLESIANDSSIRAVILNANGPAFCAGHDLKEMRRLREEGLEGYQNVFGQCSVLMQTIVRLPQPVIAQVEGMATAAGCQMVASCDMAVACEERALFATPGVNIGLFCSTPMVAISRNLPRKHVMEMLLTGNPVSPQKAESLGLVNRVVASGNVSNETLELASLVAEKSRVAVRTGKEAFYKQLELPLEDAYTYCSEIMAMNMMENDAQEGVSAFLEKRKPKW
eukprot:CAMPEP_0167766834 /NCGR_PEP_ID=MMETSP0110_2-20121227/15620_1 /TAXON_ID=629695 /ORGANISM="Gymnochlora sp., Strain CCMP2014" /LENGTH=295 /DNA_ID=CAMNT_0007655017 /DNA_START=1474 /DNA_END=2358 /DNA_ORIENTATION=+